MQFLFRPILFVTVVVISCASNALTRNGEAHQIVAWAAEERLSDKAGVKELLGDAATSDAEWSS